MKMRVLVLGAGFGGLELTTLLSGALGERLDLTLIDRSDAFVFGLTKLDAMETLMGPEKAARMFFHGTKRSRQMGNLLLALMGPGVASATAARRMADSEIELHHDDVGWVVCGIRPAFFGHVATTDGGAGAPYAAFVPHPG